MGSFLVKDVTEFFQKEIIEAMEYYLVDYNDEEITYSIFREFLHITRALACSLIIVAMVPMTSLGFEGSGSSFG